ncbi:MAG: hypothetical protein IPN19_05935 [Elusimicrobia bacterium]|nr:hypothetical protein [Elusimicrobiota bacterium]
MNQELEHLIQEVQEICLLLEKTTFRKHAVWYKDRCTALGSENLRPKEIESTILEIKKSLVGMGSFHDMPLAPAKGETISAKDLRNKQWELVDRVGKTIERIHF